MYHMYIYGNIKIFAQSAYLCILLFLLDASAHQPLLYTTLLDTAIMPPPLTRSSSMDRNALCSPGEISQSSPSRHTHRGIYVGSSPTFVVSSFFLALFQTCEPLVRHHSICVVKLYTVAQSGIVGPIRDPEDGSFQDRTNGRIVFMVTHQKKKKNHQIQ